MERALACTSSRWAAEMRDSAEAAGPTPGCLVSLVIVCFFFFCCLRCSLEVGATARGCFLPPLACLPITRKSRDHRGFFFRLRSCLLHVVFFCSVATTFLIVISCPLSTRLPILQICCVESESSSLTATRSVHTHILVVSPHDCVFARFESPIAEVTHELLPVSSQIHRVRIFPPLQTWIHMFKARGEWGFQLTKHQPAFIHVLRSTATSTNGRSVAMRPLALTVVQSTVKNRYQRKTYRDFRNRNSIRRCAAGAFDLAPACG
jgi:hypothetical protein